ncbi:hypothetical protein FZ942_11695 [Azospirillum lipoferum]|uniref:Uncharacterized protein n=1 Tax=Azospirillum lipoferum TaxID=193 RepID=A0A5A9GQJ3_AZOLI|nr:hypothetical protein [Azospirillum lipoferum]KAA0596746.1 hypothetical protein FZ942_11695 [Azospirillum lipoferum]
MPGAGRTVRLSGAITVAALAALLAMSAVNRAAAEPLLSAPEAQESTAPQPSPTLAKPQTDAFDCWLLDPDRLEQASGHGLCGDAFARAPETASLPEAPPPPLPSVTPARKPKAPERRVRSAGRSVSSAESHTVTSSPARVARSSDGDFFTNFQRDFRSLTNLLGGGSPSPRRGDDSPASHTSHNH